jgi:hypothetical protein
MQIYTYASDRCRVWMRWRPRSLLTRHAAGVAIAALTLISTTAHGQEQPPSDASDLAKKTQNPVSDLTSLPFQFNFYSGGGLGKQTQMVLNFQPVIPIKTVTGYNIIARTIVPFVSIPTGSGTTSSGIGDIQEQLFLSPAKPGKIIWGIGPVLSFPTATNQLLATGDFAAGPAVVALATPGPWVIGVLVTQLWTYAGPGGSTQVNAFSLQYLVNYNFGIGWSISSSPLIGANFSAPSGQQWTVPWGLGISKVTAIGSRPVSLALQYYNNVIAPPGAGRNQVRMQFTLLYPAAHKQ